MDTPVYTLHLSNDLCCAISFSGTFLWHSLHAMVISRLKIICFFPEGNYFYPSLITELHLAFKEFFFAAHQVIYKPKILNECHCVIVLMFAKDCNLSATVHQTHLKSFVTWNDTVPNRLSSVYKSLGLFFLTPLKFRFLLGNSTRFNKMLKCSKCTH